MPEYVALIRPRIFLIENVRDLVRHRSGRTLVELVRRLLSPTKRLRYRVEFRVYDAAAFGTPQARRRILLLGVREGAGTECLPPAGPDLSPLFGAVRHGKRVPAHFRSYLQALQDPNDGSLTTAAQALSDLPRLGPGVDIDECAYASAPRTAFQRWARKGSSKSIRDTRTPAVTEETVDRLIHIPPGGSVGSIPRQFLNGLSRRYSSAYRRLHPNAPSTALSTKYDCVYHYTEHRSLSVREYARLQGIPDAVSFPSEIASRRSCYEMIGNSVPPLLVERVLGAALEGRRRRGGS
jgi:DNA (cytosine-5)-methyltransferase 1